MPEIPKIQIGEERIAFPIGWTSDINTMRVCRILGRGIVDGCDKWGEAVFVVDWVSFSSVERGHVSVNDWERLSNDPDLGDIAVLHMDPLEYKQQLGSLCIFGAE